MAGLNSTSSALGNVASQARGLILPASFAAAAYMAQKQISQLIDEMDRMNDGAKRLGMIPEEYQKIAFAAKLAGASAESLEPAFQRMNATLYGADEEGKAAQETLNRLGLSLEWLKTLSPEQRFAAIAKSLRQISDDTERANRTQQLFGRGAISLKPLIDDYDNLSQELEAVGGVIDGNVIDAADRFNDSILKISTSIKALTANSGLIGWLAEIAGSFEDIARAKALIVDEKTLSPEQKAEKNTGKFREAVTAAADSKTAWVNVYGLAAKAALAMGIMDRANGEFYSPSLMPDVEKRGNQKYLQEQARAENERRNEKKRLEEEARLNATPYGPYISDEMAMALRKASEAEDKAKATLGEVMEEMRLKLSIQNKINDGKEKEAFIEQELARAKNAAGRGLGADEADAITEAAAKLYDAKTAKDAEESKTDLFGARPERMDVDRLTKLGLYNFNFGGARDTKALDQERNTLLKRIAEKVGITTTRTELA